MRVYIASVGGWSHVQVSMHAWLTVIPMELQLIVHCRDRQVYGRPKPLWSQLYKHRGILHLLMQNWIQAWQQQPGTYVLLGAIMVIRIIIIYSHCVDIDECAFGTHNRDQVCHNNVGSFTCTCSWCSYCWCKWCWHFHIIMELWWQYLEFQLQ